MIRAISRWATDKLINRVGSFRGKRQLVRLIGGLCEGEMLRSRYGILMEAHLGDKTNWFALSAAYDMLLFKHVISLAKGGAFIDVGANQGLFSILAGTSLGENGIVLAFEPQVAIATTLRRNVLANGLSNVLAFDFALGVRTQSARIFSDHSHSGIAHISEAGTRPIFVVEPALLLPLIHQLVGSREVTIKIDVEGYETEVLKSLRPIFRVMNVCTCLVEIDPHLLKRAASSPAELYGLMHSLGFTPELGAGHSAHFDEIFRR